jgi:hypothetical protein
MNTENFDKELLKIQTLTESLLNKTLSSKFDYNYKGNTFIVVREICKAISSIKETRSVVMEERLEDIY